MGFYIRKAFRAGPVRFNLSKSGVGLSAGVRGARIGMGPRGAYVHGGRGGLYYRKQVGGTARSHQSSSVKIAGTDGRPAEQTSPTAGASGCLRVLSVLLVPLAFLIDWRVGVGIAAVAVAVIWKRRRQAAWKEQHEMLVGALDANPNEELLVKLSTSISSAHCRMSEWQRTHEEAYSKVFSEALNDGLDDDERAWLARLASALRVADVRSLEIEALRARLWEFMADKEVTEEEEELVGKLIADVGAPRSELSDELGVLKEFVRARQARQEGLPVVDVQINLRRGETCHHVSRGALLKKLKREGLVVDKEGELYLTSKRILIVGDGTTSIPHDKVLDVEVDHDEKVIQVSKDGRQQPIYLRVPDVVYTGAIIEMLTTSAG